MALLKRGTANGDYLLAVANSPKHLRCASCVRAIARSPVAGQCHRPIFATRFGQVKIIKRQSEGGFAVSRQFRQAHGFRWICRPLAADMPKINGRLPVARQERRLSD